jgi:hypothetical protein
MYIVNTLLDINFITKNCLQSTIKTKLRSQSLRKKVIFLAVGAIKNKKIIGALEWLERFAYRKTDRIEVV